MELAALLLAVFACALSVDGRTMLQANGQTSSVAAPSSTSVYMKLHGVGTQNYTQVVNGSYLVSGALAFLFNRTEKTGRHFYDIYSDPVFELVDAASGASLGKLTGTQGQLRPGDMTGAQVASAPAVPSPSDGGLGSVSQLLFTAGNQTGVFGAVKYVQQTNVLGGNSPPQLHGLPLYEGAVPNAQLAVPYQADYTFLTASAAPAPAPATAAAGI